MNPEIGSRDLASNNGDINKQPEIKLEDEDSTKTICKNEEDGNSKTETETETGTDEKRESKTDPLSLLPGPTKEAESLQNVSNNSMNDSLAAEAGKEAVKQDNDNEEDKIETDAKDRIKASSPKPSILSTSKEIQITEAIIDTSK
eukprot:CAMPEP_0168200528 /NCGR_PEP_ID=MMETSP0139_2-20121125/23150_1 /TAXON_ID=44445 /ORGANISM="Pseudo-nitzschia australis, Strain 10249 10 AB" /LENGTH=144 /DNA_ID=CAMNT_0008125881 /DNA_START=468 /DNA_END=903 /DNA_ORIENTATION=-